MIENCYLCSGAPCIQYCTGEIVGTMSDPTQESCPGSPAFLLCPDGPAFHVFMVPDSGVLSVDRRNSKSGVLCFGFHVKHHGLQPRQLTG